MFSHDRMEVLHFWQEHPTSDAMPFSELPVRRFVMTMGPAVKVMSARFLLHKFTVFPLTVN